ncbi:hypothetical protein QOT17_003421 [Balamuthia mandrillaris]
MFSINYSSPFRLPDHLSDAAKVSPVQTEWWLSAPAKSTFTTELGEMMNNSNFYPDVVLSCSEGQLFCHRGLLACRSKKFVEIFQQEEKWKTGNQDGLPVLSLAPLEPELTLDALKHILTYCYTDQLEETTMQRPDVIFASILFSLPQLILLCQRSCLKGLDSSNAIQYLNLALQHEELSLLRNETALYVLKNIDGFIMDCKTLPRNALLYLLQQTTATKDQINVM